MNGEIRFESDATIATLTLSNPAKLNAINATMWSGLRDAMARIAAQSRRAPRLPTWKSTQPLRFSTRETTPRASTHSWPSARRISPGSEPQAPRPTLPSGV